MRYRSLMADEESSGTTSTSTPVIIGILVSLAGVIAAIFALPQYRLSWLVVVVIASVPPASWWLKRDVWQRRYRQGFTPFLAALVVVATGAALITALQNIPTQSTEAETDQSPPQAHEDSAAPININRLFNTSEVGECLRISLSGIVPTGEELVVANQLQGSGQRYFKLASMGTDSDTWSADLTLGSEQMPTGLKTQTFTIYAALMTNWLADYLATTQQYQGSTNTFWASSQWPPSALKTDEIAVIRTEVTGPRSCQP
jgi:hypothetical protein